MSDILITIDSIHIDYVTVGQVPQGSLRWHVGPIIRKGGLPMPLDITMTSEEQVKVSIAPQTPGGAPAPIDGAADFSIEGACTLEPIDDTSVWVVAGDSVGDSVLTVSADADMGSGFVPIADTAVIHVSSPMAANLGLSADEPVLKDA